MEKTSAKNIITDSRSSVKITMTALFAALCCIATMVIQIPTPTNGFINLGDCIVLISGYLLGPVYGALAAGIGSMLADILSGYAYYAPATFIIKAVMAVCAYYLYKALTGKKSKSGQNICHVTYCSCNKCICMRNNYDCRIFCFLRCHPRRRPRSSGRYSGQYSTGRCRNNHKYNSSRTY